MRIVVRRVEADELPHVEESIPAGAPGVLARHLAEQEAGRAVFLGAWLGSRPVGRVLLRWSGPGSRQMISRTSHLDPHPYVEALFVLPAFRSQTIGSQLLDTAEVAAWERGFDAIGLAVGVWNVRARALYERRGYRDTGIGEIESGYAFVDVKGVERYEREICVYLVKQLGEAPDASQD